MPTPPEAPVHTIDIINFDELESRRSKARDEEKQLQSTSFIHRVPKSIRDVDTNVYSPSVVSIGPLHRGSRHLRGMDAKKLLYLNAFLSRAHVSDTRTLMTKFQGNDKETFLSKVRGCYTNEEELPDNNSDVGLAHATENSNISKKIVRSTSMPDHEYAEMIMIDGCFVVEFLVRFVNKDQNRIVNSWEFRSIKHDLMLLENQLPYFVLEKLFQIIPQPKTSSSKDQTHKSEEPPKHAKPADGHEKVKSLGDYINDFFQSMLNCKPHNSQIPAGDKHNHKHILDFVHNCYVPRDLWKENENENAQVDVCFIYSAAELKLAGVKFKARSEAKHLLDVRFTQSCCSRYLRFGTKSRHRDYTSRCCPLWWLCAMCWRPHLHIPKLEICDATKLLLRNLIAHEQNSFAEYRFFSQYAYILDKLVNNEKDVRVLIESGIIENNLGSEKEVVSFFNSVFKEVTMGYFCFVQPWKQVNEYYQDNFPRRIAALKGGYFSDTWVGIATIGACILLAVTVVQTVYTVLGYFK